MHCVACSCERYPFVVVISNWTWLCNQNLSTSRTHFWWSVLAYAPRLIVLRPLWPSRHAQAVHHSAVLVLGAFHICVQSWFDWWMCAYHIWIDFALFPNRHQVALLTMLVYPFVSRTEFLYTQNVWPSKSKQKRGLIPPPHFFAFNHNNSTFDELYALTGLEINSELPNVLEQCVD